MYRLRTEHTFDAAHFLAHYEGKCHNIHGHHWKVEIEIQGSNRSNETQTRGMLVDFSDLKHDLRSAVDAFDHTLIVEQGTLSPALAQALREQDFSVTEVPFRPTAENFARFFYDAMTERGYDVAVCRVFETPVNCAAYCGETEGV